MADARSSPATRKRRSTARLMPKSPRARNGLRMLSMRWGQVEAIASRPLPGTATGISKSTTARPARDAFCTESIRASFPTRSNTSCITRKTRMCSSTRRLRRSSRSWPHACRLCAAGWRFLRETTFPDEARRASRLRRSPGEGFARLRMAAPRREHGLDALLYLRHNRQSEGRDVLASLDGVARARRLWGRRIRTCGARFDPHRVPLFHANAWSLPFSAAMCGASSFPVRSSILKAFTCCLRVRGAPRPSVFRRSG